jgi:hypothetical protein
MPDHWQLEEERQAKVRAGRCTCPDCSGTLTDTARSPGGWGFYQGRRLLLFEHAPYRRPLRALGCFESCRLSSSWRRPVSQSALIRVW